MIGNQEIRRLGMKVSVRSAIIYMTMFCQREKGMTKDQLQTYIVQLMKQVGWSYEQLFDALVLVNEMAGDDKLPCLINNF